MKWKQCEIGGRKKREKRVREVVESKRRENRKRVREWWSKATLREN